MKKRQIILGVAGLAVAGSVVYIAYRHTDEQVLAALRNKKSNYIQQEAPRRRSAFIELVQAYEEYIERHSALATKDSATYWLGNPDEEWPDVDKPNEISFVYFYHCTAEEKCAFFVVWDKIKDRIVNVMPATFSKEGSKYLPNKAL